MNIEDRYERNNALDYLSEADDLDRRIIKEIRAGGYDTIKDLAQAVGLSRFQLYRRIEKMKKALKKVGW